MMLANLYCEHGKVLLIGLTEENIALMKAGRPVHIKKEKHGEAVPPGWEILIVTGKDEGDLFKTLMEAGAISSDTIIRRNPNL